MKKTLACYCGYVEREPSWTPGDGLPWCPTKCGRIISPLFGPNWRRIPWTTRLGMWYRRQRYMWTTRTKKDEGRT